MRQDVTRFVTKHVFLTGIKKVDGHLRGEWFLYEEHDVFPFEGIVSVKDGVDAFTSLEDAKSRVKEMIIHRKAELERESKKLDRLLIEMGS